MNVLRSAILLALIFCLTSSLSFGQSNNNIVIDDFSVAQEGAESVQGMGAVGTTLVTESVLGGERDISSEAFGEGAANAESVVENMVFSFSVDAAATGTGSIVYDGTDGDALTIDPTGLGGVDLTNGGTEDRFKITVVFADQGAAITINVYSAEGISSTFTQEYPDMVTDEALEIFFDQFSGDADFTNVGAVEFTVTSENPSVDVTLDRICTEGPARCELSSISAGDAMCVEGDQENYTVTVDWTGVDETVTIIAGGSGTPDAVPADAAGTVTFTYPTSEGYNIIVSDTDGLCDTTFSNPAPDCTFCTLEGISAGDPVCDGQTSYTVTVTWSGSDESVTFNGGEGAEPASAVADDTGEVTFTYPTSTGYNITTTDTDEKCEFSDSGDAPDCTICTLEGISAGDPACDGQTSYTVTVTWSGSDESVTFNGGEGAEPASAIADESGEVTFTYSTSTGYNITTTDTDEKCEFSDSGDAPDCTICTLEGMAAGGPVCGDDESYSVTVTWSGSDESVTINGGSGADPASAVADESGEVTFTYSTSSGYDISVTDTDEKCEFSANGPAPNCCGVSNIQSSYACIEHEVSYRVRVTWDGSDESVTINGGAGASPASAVADASGSVTFEYPFDDSPEIDEYTISFTDSDGQCNFNPIIGWAKPCGIPTMGEWALICLVLGFFILGTIAMRQYVFEPSGL